jgi:hypothetical protein
MCSFWFHFATRNEMSESSIMMQLVGIFTGGT